MKMCHDQQYLLQNHSDWRCDEYTTVQSLGSNCSLMLALCIMDNRGDHKPSFYLKCQVQGCVTSTLNENRMVFLDLSRLS